jgi:hypothetical protein
MLGWLYLIARSDSIIVANANLAKLRAAVGSHIA